MKTRRSIVLLLVAVLMSACGAQPTATTEINTEIPIASPSETPFPLSEASPSATDTPTATFTASAPVVTAGDEAVNCRYGPGTIYAAVSGLAAGSSADILGTSANGDFWQIANPGNSGGTCWVAASVTSTAGDTAKLPVVAAPTSLVTDVFMSTPDTIETATCSDSISAMDLVGTIEVNGPLSVSWYFETEQDGALSVHKSNFTTSGSFVVEDSSYTPSLEEGTYWVRLVVTKPITWTATASYIILCE